MIVYGILIAYLLIQTLTRYAKEFAISGETTSAPEQGFPNVSAEVWRNMHLMLRDFYKNDYFTIPRNVHIKGNLLVGTYKVNPLDDDRNYASYPIDGDDLTETNWDDSCEIAMSKPFYHLPKKSQCARGGSIYSWHATHQEMKTVFICRDDVGQDNVYKKIECPFLDCGYIETKEMQKQVPGDTNPVDPDARTRAIKIFGNNSLGACARIEGDLKIEGEFQVANHLLLDGEADNNIFHNISFDGDSDDPQSGRLYISSGYSISGDRNNYHDFALCRERTNGDDDT
jgi:hypothetical protein